MPGGDRTGPLGLGPMTGRAVGYCAGYPVPGFMNPYVGRLHLRLGFGYGRGFRRAFWPVYPYPMTPLPVEYGGKFYQPPVDPKQEIEMLTA